MLYIPEQEIEAAMDALEACTLKATTTSGHRIVWGTDRRTIEKAVFAALQFLSPTPGDAIVMEGTKFIHGLGQDDCITFPPDRKKEIA